MTDEPQDTNRKMSLERSDADLSRTYEQSRRVIKAEEGRSERRVDTQEILQAINGLMDKLSTGRRIIIVAEDQETGTQIENARLKAQLEVERELRRRLAAQLDDRKDFTEVREGTLTSLDRSWAENDRRNNASGEASGSIKRSGRKRSMDKPVGRLVNITLEEIDQAFTEEQERRERAEARLQRLETERNEMRARAIQQLERIRWQGSEEALQHVKDALERLIGEKLPTVDEEKGPTTSPGSLPTRVGGSPSEGAFSYTRDQPRPVPEPPPHPETEFPILPPGWKYASDLPLRRRRWLRRRSQR
jgi:hypothetical protein